jgi:hypothetical protein
MFIGMFSGRFQIQIKDVPGNLSNNVVLKIKYLFIY